ncbi:ribose-phosphate diphosphokinase [Gilvimarinus sp. F26214L]|uniref:ribose-phosphate diphosphokinase n=1 Tax=Gilvimarinus sp. DZF01 TaxID=3461371 RepID=UPI0040457D4E
MAPLLFALHQSTGLGERLAARLGLTLSAHEERDFPDGEHKIRPLVEVYGQRVYVLHSLYSDSRQSANDKLCRLLFFLGALRDAGAASVMALVPYLPYARKDRRTKLHDPLTSRYVAMLFEALGVDAVVSLGVHNPAAEQNAFRCGYEDLDPAPLFVEHLVRELKEPLSILAPDTGAIKNAQHVQQLLSERGLRAELAFMTKIRSQDIVTSSPLFGEIDGRSVLIYDDLISSGTTIANALGHCEGRASAVYVAACHGMFSPAVAQLLPFKCLRNVFVSDSVHSDGVDRADWGQRLQVLDCSSLFAKFIQERERAVAHPGLPVQPPT